MLLFLVLETCVFGRVHQLEGPSWEERVEDDADNEYEDEDDSD